MVFDQVLKLRNDIRKDELMDAIVKSDKSYDEILAYISDGNDTKAKRR